MKMQLTIYAGIGEDKARQPIHDLQNKLEDIRLYLALQFGGYTETAASGGWINGKMELVKEPSVMFTTVTDANDAAFKAAAQHIASVLNQESVLYTVHAVVAQFVMQETDISKAFTKET